MGFEGREAAVSMPECAEGLLNEVYNRQVKPFLNVITRLYVRDGRTVDEIAKRLKVDDDIFNIIWESPRFSELWAVTHDEKIRDKRSKSVENALYKLARGYDREVTKPFILHVERTYVNKKGKKSVVKEETIKYATYVEHVAPNALAAQFWLSNRMPSDWMDAQRIQLALAEKQADKGPSEVAVTFVDADTEEQRKRIEGIDKAVGALEAEVVKEENRK